MSSSRLAAPSVNGGEFVMMASISSFPSFEEGAASGLENSFPPAASSSLGGLDRKLFTVSLEASLVVNSLSETSSSSL